MTNAIRWWSDVDVNNMNFHSVSLRVMAIASILAVNGCGPVKVYPTEVHGLAFEVLQENKISLGDTQETVRSVLGAPLIEVSEPPVEVFRQTGRDFQIVLPGVPIPTPWLGEKILGFVLVTYDGNQIVTDLAAGTWSHGKDFRITAGGYQFVNKFLGEPETLLAPAVPVGKLVTAPPPAGKCTLVLVMTRWAMERVLLDGEQVADFTPTRSYILVGQSPNSLSGTYLSINISAGRHRLNVDQKHRHSEFDTFFECVSGEAVYAELFAEEVKDIWWGTRLEGEILITNAPSKSLMDIGGFSPILWHRGKWYGSSSYLLEESR